MVDLLISGRRKAVFESMQNTTVARSTVSHYVRPTEHLYLYQVAVGFNFVTLGLGTLFCLLVSFMCDCIVHYFVVINVFFFFSPYDLDLMNF